MPVYRKTRPVLVAIIAAAVLLSDLFRESNALRCYSCSPCDYNDDANSITSCFGFEDVSCKHAVMPSSRGKPIITKGCHKGKVSFGCTRDGEDERCYCAGNLCNTNDMSEMRRTAAENGAVFFGAPAATVVIALVVLGRLVLITSEI